MSSYWFCIWTCLKHSGHLSTGKKIMWECRKDKSGARCNSNWTNSISNLQNTLSSLSKNREKTIEKAKYSGELKKYRYWNREGAAEKRHWLKFSAESVPRNNLPLITLCTHTVSSAGLWVCTHQPCPSPFTWEYLAQPTWEIHPVSILPYFPAQACLVGGSARPPRPLQLSWRKWGLHNLACVTSFEWRLEGKPLLLPWSGHTSCRNLGVSLPEISVVRLPDKQSTDWLQATPSANGICARSTRSPWLCPRLWNNPLHGLCQQRNPGTMGC